MPEGTALTDSPVLRLGLLGEGVRCEVLDGDDWPVTQLADGSSLAAYGDGWGARPLDPATKRNTGLVRIRGTAPAPVVEEAPCPWFGGGAERPNLKGCGLLACDGVLHHFLRYQVDGRPGAGRPQVAAKLITSTDGGATWSGGDYGPDAQAMDWFFPGALALAAGPGPLLHSPTFLQAGSDYAAAPDDHAYVYSPREDRRFANDRLDLARVRRDRIGNPAAYRFFAGLEAGGGALWTADPAGRAPVLTLPGQIGSGDVVYLPGLRRYLLATCATGTAEGEASTLLLCDAPSPWGPWTLVARVAPWGIGTAGDRRYDPRLPVAWIQEDPSALELVLVYSDRRPADRLNWQTLRLEVVRGRGGAAGPGRSRSALDAAVPEIMARGTNALQVIQGGRLLAEAYAQDWGPARRHGAASLSKWLAGGLPLLAALGQGHIGLDDPVCRYVPAWVGDPLRAAITVRHLAMHTSGLEDAEEGGLPHDRLTGWKGQFWRREPDPFSIARDQAPVLFAPGTRCQYSNPGMAMLSYALASALAARGAPDVHDLLASILETLGVGQEAWRIGYSGPTELDGLRLYASWGGASFTPRAVATVGRLLVDGGRLGGHVVLDPTALAQVLGAGAGLHLNEPDGPLVLPGLYRNADSWPEIPADALLGAGAGHQVLVVIPSADLVIVRMGTALAGRDLPFWTAVRRLLLGPLVTALGL